MPHEIVAAPGLRKASNGLVEVGNRVDVGDDHWENGVAFTPRGCQVVFAHVPFCPSEDKSNFAECTPAVRVVPYLLEAGLVWSLVDMGADPKGILTEAFDIGTSPVLERLAWEGIADVIPATPIALPAIAGAAATGAVVGRIMATAVAPPTLSAQALATGVTGTPVKAIGAVEAKLLDGSDHIGGAGTIFMSPVVAAQAEWALERVGGDLVTRATGSRVVVGNVDADKVIGVIGDVDVYLGEVIVLELQERSKNEWVGRAERRALAVWNPCGVFSAVVT
jgi:hypothetical protein